MRITLTDIARRVSKSPSTVSLAIRGVSAGKRNISPETAKLIKQVAKEMGYRPNMTARSLRNQKTYTVGVLQGGFHGGFNDHRLDGIDAVLSPAYSSIVATHKYDGYQERMHLNSFIDSRLDGIIVSPTDDPKSIELYCEIAENHRIPLVFMDRRVGGLKSPLVATDAAEFTYQATKSVLDMGHRKIVFASQSFPKETTENNREGYRKAMRQANCGEHINIIMLEKVSHIACDSQSVALKIINKWINEFKDATAILLPFDDIAYHFLDECDRKGIKVPEDISIISLGDEISSSLRRINLSSVAEDLEAMGKKTAQLILKIIDGIKHEQREFLYPGKVRLRGTTGKLLENQ